MTIDSKNVRLLSSQAVIIALLLLGGATEQQRRSVGLLVAVGLIIMVGVVLRWGNVHDIGSACPSSLMHGRCSDTRR